MNKKLVTGVIVAIVAIIMLIEFNPFAYNEAGNRTVVETPAGAQFVQFKNGVFWAGFFSKATEWPNQLTVSYQAEAPVLEVVDGTIEIGKISIRFNDGSTAFAKGITQYLLPNDEKEMITLHNAHKTPQSLVTKRLSPYTSECLKSSAQLMSSEMHYGGGRAQMAQDNMNQLQNGVYLLEVKEVLSYDSLSKENRRSYQTKIQLKKDGTALRKASSLTEYGINVADAVVTDVDYEDRIDGLLAKKIDATTKASISKQELVTAQQQALTAKAKGEQALVEIEYNQRQEQTKQVVAAQTKVRVAEQDMAQQKIQAQAAMLEAQKIKTLADAHAYEKRTAMQANGALEQKLDAYVKVMGFYSSALENSKQPFTPQYLVGGSGGATGNNAAQNFYELMNIKTMKDLNLSLKEK